MYVIDLSVNNECAYYSAVIYRSMHVANIPDQYIRHTCSALSILDNKVHCTILSHSSSSVITCMDPYSINITV